MNINKLILSLVFIIPTIAIVSCAQQTTYEKPRVEEYSGSKFLKVYEFSYKGHNYLYFFKREAGVESGGVIHDPNCCK
jgi:hypothetical protein